MHSIYDRPDLDTVIRYVYMLYEVQTKFVQEI